MRTSGFLKSKRWFLKLLTYVFQSEFCQLMIRKEISQFAVSYGDTSYFCHPEWNNHIRSRFQLVDVISSLSYSKFDDISGQLITSVLAWIYEIRNKNYRTVNEFWQNAFQRWDFHVTWCVFVLLNWHFRIWVFLYDVLLNWKIWTDSGSQSRIDFRRSKLIWIKVRKLLMKSRWISILLLAITAFTTGSFDNIGKISSRALTRRSSPGGPMNRVSWTTKVSIWFLQAVRIFLFMSTKLDYHLKILLQDWSVENEESWRLAQFEPRDS